MSSLSVSSSTKQDFDDLQPDDTTQDDFVCELLEVYRAFEGEPVDHEKLADELKRRLGPQVELGAYRGTRDYCERHQPAPEE